MLAICCKVFEYTLGRYNPPCLAPRAGRKAGIRGPAAASSAIAPTLHLMTVDLTRDEIWFLKALRAAGERGRIISALASQAGLVRLVEVQYVTRRPQSERKTLYVITHRGRQALANAPHAIDERDRRIN